MYLLCLELTDNMEINWDSDTNAKHYLTKWNYSVIMKEEEISDDTITTHTFSLKGNRNFWYNGKKINCNVDKVRDVVVTTGAIDPNNVLTVMDFHGNPSVYNFLYLPQYVVPFENNEQLRCTKILKGLEAERKLLQSLRKQYKQWRLNQCTHKLDTFYSLNIYLSKGSGAVIVGKMNYLERYCQQYNNRANPLEIRKVTDKANLLFVLPMKIFKLNVVALKTELYKIYDEKYKLMLGNKEMDISVNKIEWSSLAFKNRENLVGSDNYIEKLTATDIYIKNHLSIPYWLKDDDKDYINEYGVIVSIVCYDDRIHFTMSGGKRQLGETNFECIQREMYEEIGVIVYSNTSNHTTGGVVNTTSSSSSNTSDDLDSVFTKLKIDDKQPSTCSTSNAVDQTQFKCKLELLMEQCNGGPTKSGQYNEVGGLYIFVADDEE